MAAFILDEARSFTVTVLPSGQVRIDLPEGVEPAGDEGERRYDVRGVAHRLGTGPRAVYALMKKKHNPLPHSKPAGRLVFWENEISAWEKRGGRRPRLESHIALGIA